MKTQTSNATSIAAALLGVAFAGIAAAQDVPLSHKASPDIYKVIAEDERYVVMESKRKAGETRITPPVVAHTFENLAQTDCKHIHVEMK